MNNVFVYCEMEGAHVADVSLELLTKGRKLDDRDHLYSLGYPGSGA